MQLHNATGSWSTYKAWIGKGSLAIIDQAVMTGSNFIVGVLLARWLSPDQYGAYAIAYAFFLLLSLVFQAMILEPMSVFGPSTYREQWSAYLGTLMRAYLALSALLVVVIAVATLMEWKISHAPVLSAALLGMAVATPCILLLWLARNAFYVKLLPQGSAMGGVLYSALLLGGIAVLHRYYPPSPLAVFLLMASAGFVTATVQFSRLRPAYKAGSEVTLANVCRQHWGYGRWIFASSLVVWIPSNIYYVLFSRHSMVPAAELRALMNLTLPVAQTATALSLLVQPYLAREQSCNGTRAVLSGVRTATALYALGAAAYWAILLVFSKQAIQFLYGGKYSTLTPLVPFVAISSIFAVTAHGPGAGLRAIKAPSSVFIAFCAASVISTVIGIPATLSVGLPGSVATLVVANTVAFVLVLRLFYRRAYASADMSLGSVSSSAVAVEH